MSINLSFYPIHLPDGFRFDRKSVKPQECQNTGQKLYGRQDPELSLFTKEDREAMNEIRSHIVEHAVTSFGDTRAGILREVREEKGRYDYSDVVNACALSYARLYSEIEERYKNGDEQYYKFADGTPWTKEEEIDWLNMEYEQEVAWQKACARAAARGQVYMKRIPEVPEKEIEELEDRMYQAKDAYMKQYQENKQYGKPLTLQNNTFGSWQMYEKLNKIGNLI